MPYKNAQHQRIYAKQRRALARIIATKFVSEVNAGTNCTKCGKKPIEWHREYHEEHPNSRVSSLRAQGCSVQRIKNEMALCEPLCRSCHMMDDGRLQILKETQPYQKGQTYVDYQPCKECGKLTKPLRRGFCNYHYIKFMGIR